MIRVAVLVAVCVCITSSAFSTSVKLFSPAPACSSVPAFETAHYVRVDSAAVARMRATPVEASIELSLDGTHAATLNLIPDQEMLGRMTWTAITDSGWVKLVPPNILFYKGTVAGDATSRVCIGIDGNGIMGSVFTGGHGYTIDHVHAPTRPGTYCIVYQDAKRPESMGQVSCATRDDNPVRSQENQRATGPSDGGAAQPTAQYLARIAVQTDVDMLNYFTSEDALKTYIAQLFAQVTSIYESEINTQIDTTSVFINTAANASYSKTDLPGMLADFTADWNANMTSVPRAAAVLLSKRGCGASGFGGCGFADLDALCVPGRAYSANQVCGNVMVIDRFIVTHEIGHNFGARHTHSCWWVDNGFSSTPIEQCAAVEDGSCFTDVVQSTGTLMGYCTQKEYTFGTIVGPWVKTHTQQLAASGQGCFVSAKKLAVIDSLFNFGVLLPGTTKDSIVSALLTNVGQQSVNVISMKLSGPDSAKFSIVSGGGSFALAAGAKRSVKLRFVSDSVGPRDAYLTVVHSAPNSPLVIHLIGAGGRPEVAVATTTGDSTLDWTTSDASNIENVYVSNSGAFPLHVSKSAITGPDSSMFTIASGGGAFTLIRDAVRTIGIRFTPKSSGIKHAMLAISSDAQPPVHTVALNGNTVSAVRDGAPESAALTLEQNYPNPVDANASMRTMIGFSIPERADAVLSVIDIYGRTVASLVNERIDAGRYQSMLDVRRLVAGTYLLRLQCNSHVVTKMMHVVR